MRRVIQAIALLALLTLSACGSLTTPAAQPLTKYEARNMPEGALIRRSTDLLADELVYYPTNDSKRPITVLSDLYFLLKPHASDYPNMCVVTNVILGFTPESTPGSDSRTPTRVRSLSTEDDFRLLDPAATLPAEWDEVTATSLDRAHDACGHLNPDGTDNFRAETSEIAYHGARLYQSLLLSLKSGKSDFAIDCEDEDRCAATFARLDMTDIFMIAPCETKVAGTSCLAFGLGLGLEVQFTGPIHEPKVSSVKYRDTVIIADYTID